MKKVIVIVVLIVAGFITYNYVTTGGFLQTGSKREAATKTAEEKMPLKIFVAADATGSLEDNGISKLTTSHLRRLIDSVKVRGGQIGLLIINDNCGKTPLLRVTIQKEPVSPIYPTQVVSETAYNYGQRLKQYHVDRKRFLADSMTYSTRSIPQMRDFMEDAEVLLRNAYARLAKNSDCVGAFNLSSKFHMEPSKNSTTMKHISIFISDMLHDAPLNQSIIQQIPEADFYVVRSKKTQDCMPEEVIYMEFENIDATLDHIL